MLVFVLVLLLIAAVLGILGWVIKVTAVLVLSAILAVVFLGTLLWWMVKKEARQYLDAASGNPGKPRQVYEAEGKIRRPELPE